MPSDENLNADLVAEIDPKAVYELFKERPSTFTPEQRMAVVQQIRKDRAAQLEKKAKGRGQASGASRKKKEYKPIAGVDLGTLVEDLTLPGMEDE